MKIFKKILRVIIFFLCFFVQITAYCGTCLEADDISRESYLPGIIASLEADSGTFTLLAATSKGLFASKNAGLDWNRVDAGEALRSVRDIAILEDKVALATDKGLYIGNTSLEGWRPIIGKKDLEGVVFASFDGREVIIVWNGKGLYMFDAGRWVNVGRSVIWKYIRDVVYDRGRLIVYVDNKIDISCDMGKTWKSVTLFSRLAEVDEVDVEDGEEGFSSEAGHDLLTVMSSGKIAALTLKGIYVIDEDSGKADCIDTTGLPSSKVKAIIASEDTLFASTGSNVFAYELTDGKWKLLSGVGGRGTSSAMLFYKDAQSQKWLFCSRGKALRRLRLTGSSIENRGMKNVVRGYPAINDVQRMAIEYAEVSPEKIKRWRKAASWKALLPRLSVGYSEGRDDNIEIYKSASTSYVVQGPTECDNDWSVDLSWDLSDLIWNDAQTAIDSRSKLMVQLREDILEEVTRLYFEREKLLRQVELNDPPKEGTDELDKELKIEELTAYIDALTGGEFSKAIIRK